MTLHDTIPMMESKDYKDRFLAEYLQTKIRYDKLFQMIDRYKAGTLDFEPTCSVELLEDQLKCMRRYLLSLQVRARIEGIDLNYAGG